MYFVKYFPCPTPTRTSNAETSSSSPSTDQLFNLREYQKFDPSRYLLAALPPLSVSTLYKPAWMHTVFSIRRFLDHFALPDRLLSIPDPLIP
jgi:hypothetical protein